MAVAIRKAGMEPVPALLPMTRPVQVQERGAMLCSEFTGRFGRHAREARPG